jgi:hypothetical protein
MKNANFGLSLAFAGILAGAAVTTMASPASAFVFTNNGGALNTSGTENEFTFDVSGAPLERIELTIESLAVPNLNNLIVLLTGPVPVGGQQEDFTVQLIAESTLTGTQLTDTLFSDSGMMTIVGGTAPYTGTFRAQGTTGGSANLASFDDLAVALGFTGTGTWRLRVTETTTIGGTLGRVTLRVPFNMQSTAGMIILATVWVGHRLRQRRTALASVSVPTSV